MSLNYEDVITAWASQGSPWTTGNRPEFDPKDTAVFEENKDTGSGGEGGGVWWKKTHKESRGREKNGEEGGREKKVGGIQWTSLGTTAFSLIHWPSFTMPAFENFENSIAGVVNAGL